MSLLLAVLVGALIALSDDTPEDDDDSRGKIVIPLPLTRDNGNEPKPTVVRPFKESGKKGFSKANQAIPRGQ